MTLTDIEAVKQAQSGCVKALALVLKLVKPVIRQEIYRFKVPIDQHDEVVQGVNIRLWKYLKSLKNPAAVRTFTRQMAKNYLLDDLRKKRTDPIIYSLDDIVPNTEDRRFVDTIQDTCPGPGDILERQEMLKVVREAMAELPEVFRSSLILREVYGYDYKEIAGFTNASLGTVKSRIARGRERVQKVIAPYLKQDGLE